MTTSLSEKSKPSPTTPEPRAVRRRSPWRQQLVETERGLSQGMRNDSTFFVYLFVDCLIVAVGAVLGLSGWQWIVVGLVTTLVLTAELFRQALRAMIAELIELRPQGRWPHVLHLATAAVSIALLGGMCIIVAMYWERVRELYGGY